VIRHNNYLVSNNLEVRVSDIIEVSTFSNKENSFGLSSADPIQGVPRGKVNILRSYSIGHSKQKTLYEHVSYSERFPR
jgi:hypothetical protein